jgi:hypothetical protein
MSIPQWIITILLVLSIPAGAMLDGKPRDPYSGATIWLNALCWAALLGWAGFWK